MLWRVREPLRLAHHPLPPAVAAAAAAAATASLSTAVPFPNSPRLQAPTARNAVLKHGSWAGFFQHHGLDLLALQASGMQRAVFLPPLAWAWRAASKQSCTHVACCLPPADMQVFVLAMQESKVIDDKLTKELACVDGFQSFWACSR